MSYKDDLYYDSNKSPINYFLLKNSNYLNLNESILNKSGLDFSKNSKEAEDEKIFDMDDVDCVSQNLSNDNITFCKQKNNNNISELYFKDINNNFSSLIFTNKIKIKNPKLFNNESEINYDNLEISINDSNIIDVNRRIKKTVKLSKERKILNKRIKKIKLFWKKQLKSYIQIYKFIK